MNESEIYKSRFCDLAERSYSKGIWTYSDFLSADGQSELQKMKLSVPYSLFGGYDGAERCIAVFGSELDTGYPSSPPISAVKIEPLNAKFADKLIHRDFLGSLMGLGIKREVLGDILINDSSAVLFCLDSIAEYIVSQLSCVKRTTVKCSILSDVPDIVTAEKEQRELIVASDRLDSMVAAVYKLSRKESQLLFAGGKIFVNSKCTENTSLRPKAGDMISVRGKGRFVYNGQLRSTKKDRLVISVGIY